MIPPQKYKAARVARGTQAEVAAQLGVHAQTIAKRERGAPGAPVTREAWLALLSLPELSPAHPSVTLPTPKQRAAE